MNYFESNKKRDCNGCGVCALKCPKNAITMCEDAKGFLYPKIDLDKCMNCGLCKKICPNKDYNQNLYTKTYIAINKNTSDLMNSSSGGVFIAFAKYILKQGGAVFGVAFDDNMVAKHVCIEKEDGLIKLQGSKYVRSDLNNSYESIKQILDSGRYVLFSGTPCQCKGLNVYLGKEYDNLITIEIICHANPSPKVFKLYIDNLENKYNDKIKNIKFRDKSTGWKDQSSTIEFDSGMTVIDDSYFLAFGHELINRPSCYNCHFASTNRLSDCTIGDAWGLDRTVKDIVDTNKGVSVICINNEKAEKIFNKLKGGFTLVEVNKEDAFRYNHHKNIKQNIKSSKFFKQMAKGNINSNNIIAYLNKYSKLSFFTRVKNKIKRMLKI